MTAEKRTGRYSRFIVDLPMRLEDAKGVVLDAEATVRDLAGGGFGFQTRAAIEEKTALRFSMTLPQGQIVSGTAEVMWSYHDAKGSWAGARFVEVSRKDAALIREATGSQGYDFGGLFDRALGVGTIVVLTLVARDLLDRPEFWRASWSVAPTLIAVAAMGFSALWFVRNRR